MTLILPATEGKREEPGRGSHAGPAGLQLLRGDRGPRPPTGQSREPQSTGRQPLFRLGRFCPHPGSGNCKLIPSSKQFWIYQ